MCALYRRIPVHRIVRAPVHRNLRIYNTVGAIGGHLRRKRVVKRYTPAPASDREKEGAKVREK
jgi:hypothetical protein